MVVMSPLVSKEAFRNFKLVSTVDVFSDGLLMHLRHTDVSAVIENTKGE